MPWAASRPAPEPRQLPLLVLGRRAARWREEARSPFHPSWVRPRWLQVRLRRWLWLWLRLTRLVVAFSLGHQLPFVSARSQAPTWRASRALAPAKMMYKALRCL
jgi:hypothetical protein